MHTVSAAGGSLKEEGIVHVAADIVCITIAIIKKRSQKITVMQCFRRIYKDNRNIGELVNSKTA